MTVNERKRAGALKGRQVMASRRPCSRSRVAARYAHLWRTTLATAAAEFDLTRGAVREAWRRLYPGEPALLSRRPKGGVR